MRDITFLIIKRLFYGLLTLLALSLIIFFMVEMLPGDPASAILAMGATEDNLAALRLELGLDRPAIIRYFDWLFGVFQGDFGISLVRKESVTSIISQRFLNTLYLACYAAVIAVPIAIFLGALIALFRNTLFDRIANVLTLSSISSPEFFLGYILILYFVLEKTKMGAMVRASVDDHETAQMLGINTEKILFYTFSLGCGLAGLAGVTVAPIVGVEAGMDMEVLVLTLIVVVVGGPGSLKGALVGSLLIGFVDTFGKVFLPELALITMYAAMALILIFKPGGMYSRL